MAIKIGKDVQEGAAKAKYTFMATTPTRPILHMEIKPINRKHNKIFTTDDRRLNEKECICHWDNPD